MPPSRRSRRRPARRAAAAPARARYSSGTPWEPKVGYSRAVRVGPHVYVSGTTATAADGSIVGPGDAFRQTARTLANIDRALRALGSSREAVVRLRIFVTDLREFDRVTRAIAARYRRIRPAMTLVEVRGLVDPRMLVEIEAEADDLPARTARGSRRGRARAARP